MPLNFTFGVVSTIILCSSTKCSDIPKFHQDICKIGIFIRNGYSETFIDKCVNTYLNKLFILKRIVQTTENQRPLFYPIWALSRLNQKSFFCSKLKFQVSWIRR